MSDESYIYQLSLVVATATVSYNYYNASCNDHRWTRLNTSMYQVLYIYFGILLSIDGQLAKIATGNGDRWTRLTVYIRVL